MQEHKRLGGESDTVEIVQETEIPPVWTNKCLCSKIK